MRDPFAFIKIEYADFPGRPVLIVNFFTAPAKCESGEISPFFPGFEV